MDRSKNENVFSEVLADVQENINNRVARIFISSTFRDMEKERTYLINQVFPEIRKICKERDVEFTPVDLRWGITEEQSKSGKVGEICLQEIKRSRPFFIGILGERYGWIPQVNELKLDDLDILFPSVRQDLAEGLSITEMEIQNGVLRQTEKLDAGFWFRSTEMETPEEFREKPDSDEEKKLQALKKAIETDERYCHQKYASVEELGKQIQEALLAWINARFPLNQKLTWLGEQNLGQRAFERSRTRSYKDRNNDVVTSLYVPNQDAYDSLNRFADSSEGSVFIVTGESGSGKSALLANWAQEYQKNHDVVKVLTYYVSTSEGSESPATILRQLTESLDPNAVSDDNMNDLTFGKEQGKSLNDRKRDFTDAIARYLSHTPKGKLLFIIDGLNQLSEQDDSKKLIWLPEPPKGAKFVLSTINTDKTYETVQRLEWETYSVGSLTERQKREITKRLLSSRGRTLVEEQIDKIAAADVMSNPVALRALLDRLCAFGKHEELAQKIDDYLKAQSIEELFEKIFQSVEETIDPAKLQQLTTLLAVSRYGLTEKELLQITGYSQFDISLFLCTFDDSLVNRSGLYSYSHAYIKNAVKKRYGFSIAKERDRLIEYFNGDQADFSRRCREVPYQYANKGSWDDLYEFILNPRVLDELYDLSIIDCDACVYWALLLNRPNNGNYPFKGYLTNKESKGENVKDALINFRFWFKIARLAEFFKQFEVMEQGYANSATSCIKIITKFRKLIPEYELKLLTSFYVSSLNGLANFHYQQQHMDLAEQEYRTAYNILQKLVKKYPDVYKCDLATSLNGLGIIHSDKRSFELAEKEYNKALEIRRELAEKSEIYIVDVATILNNMANLHSNTGAYVEAEKEYLEALAIYRSLIKRNQEEYGPDLVQTLNNIANLHSNHGSAETAKQEYQEALVMCIKLIDKGLGEHRPLYAGTLYNLASYHSEQGSVDLAEKEYQDAIVIYKELDEQYQGKYELDLINVLSQKVALLQDLVNKDITTNSFSLPEQKYQEAVEIYRELAKRKPDLYKPKFVAALHFLAYFHRQKGSFEWAEKELREVVTRYKEFCRENFELYNLALAEALCKLAELCKETQRFSESESLYHEALTQLQIGKSNILHFPILIEILNGQRKLHMQTDNLALAEQEVSILLKILRPIYAKYPETNKIILAETLLDAAILHKRHNSKQALSELQEALTVYREMASNVPNVYENKIVEIEKMLQHFTN